MRRIECNICRQEIKERYIVIQVRKVELGIEMSLSEFHLCPDCGVRYLSSGILQMLVNSLPAGYEFKIRNKKE